MPQKKKQNLAATAVICLFTIVSVSAPVLQWAFKIAWVFIDHESKMQNLFGIGLSQLLFLLMALNALFAVYVLVRHCAGWRSRAGNIAVTVLFVLSCVLGVAFAVVNYVCAVMARPAALGQLLPQYLPWVCALVGIPLLFLCWGSLNLKKRVRAVLSSLLAAAFVFTMVFSAASPGKARLVAGPLVLDTGAGDYAVVFATDKDTQGFVKYTYNGVEKEVYSADTVVHRIGRIHAARIPREELENNSYTLHVREARYGLIAHVGENTYGRAYQIGKAVDFAGGRDVKDPKIISVSDWHEHMPTMQRAVEAFGVTPDLVLLMGDYVSYYATQEDIVRCVIGGGSMATFGGTVPAIFARGNHEVRGNFMSLQDLDRTLGLDRLYYEVERGDFIFTVLDSAECSEWEHDDWEHALQYSAYPYYSRQLDWLDTLPPAPVGKYRVVLSHDRWFASSSDDKPTPGSQMDIAERLKAPDQTLFKRFTENLVRLGTRLEVSGHSHNYEVFRGEELPWAHGTLTSITDGGLGGIPGTAIKIGPLTLKEAVPAYTATLLEFRDGEIIMTGKRALGPDERFGGIEDEQVFSFAQAPV